MALRALLASAERRREILGERRIQGRANLSAELRFDLNVERIERETIRRAFEMSTVKLASGQAPGSTPSPWLATWPSIHSSTRTTRIALDASSMTQGL